MKKGENMAKKAKCAAKTKEGKFLTIFKKQADGSWKIYRDSVSLNPASK